MVQRVGLGMAIRPTDCSHASYKHSLGSMGWAGQYKGNP